MYTIEILKILPIVLILIFFSLFVVFFISYYVHYQVISERAFILALYPESSLSGYKSTLTHELQEHRRLTFKQYLWEKKFIKDNPFANLFYSSALDFSFDYTYVQYNYFVWSALEELRNEQ